MIVPMKKVSLVVLDKEKRDALIQLRKIGVVHLETLEGSSDRINVLKSDVDNVDRACAILSDIDAKAKQCIDMKGEDVLLKAKEICDLEDEKTECKSTISKYVAELDRFKKWGSISLEDFSYLESKGIYLSLCECSKDKYDKLPDDVKTIFVNRDKQQIRFLLLRDHENDFSKDSIQNVVFIDKPILSTTALKEEILRLSNRITQIDNSISSSVVCLQSFKNYLVSLKKDLEFENYYYGMNIEKASETCSIAWLTGFVPKDDVQKLKSLAAEQKWACSIEDPSSEDMVPTKLRNNKLVSLIYPVTDFLGTVPGYHEYDISGWFLLYFAIFFGIIFGDGGYGLLMSAVAIVGIFSSVVKKRKIGSGLLLLLLLGLATVGWGLVTCTWFGLEMQYLPNWLKNMSVTYISNATSCQSEEMSNWVSQNLQVLCFGLALSQLSVAHLKGVFRYIKSPKFLGELGSLGMLWGLFFVVLNMVVDSSRFPLPDFAIPLIGGGFLLSFIFANYDGSLGKSILESCKNIVSVLLGVVNVFSDIVSYIRLWAVGLAGSAISATVNDMAGPMLGGAIIFLAVLLLCFGHGLNMVLNTLSVIVHGVRLNTLEFSNHLGMSWSGFKYEPFTE